jgi:hypothetical protein
MATEESGGCGGIFWLQKSLMATEDGWLQRSLVATEDYGGCRGVCWLQRTLVAAEESVGCRGVWWLQRSLVAAGKSVGCRVSQESWGHIRTVVCG